MSSGAEVTRRCEEKQWCAVFLNLALALAVWADVWTDPQTGLQWTYTSPDGKEASIGDGLAAAISSDTAGELILPSEINRRSVTVPASVTSVETDAFGWSGGEGKTYVFQGLPPFGLEDCWFDGVVRYDPTYAEEWEEICRTSVLEPNARRFWYNSQHEQGTQEDRSV